VLALPVGRDAELRFDETLAQGVVVVREFRRQDGRWHSRGHGIAIKLSALTGAADVLNRLAMELADQG
jgi:hypothetical protein